MKPPAHSALFLQLLSAMLLCGCLATPCMAGLGPVTRLCASPTQYARTEFQVMVTASWQDPYDERDIALDLELLDPSGARVLIPGFLWSGSSGGSSEWRLRFSPLKAGDYSGRVRLHSRGGEESSGELRFTVLPSTARGFLRANDTWSFRYDNGTLFRGLGENLCWESRVHDDNLAFSKLHEDRRFNYEYLLGRLAANGGNFYRTWICPWNLPLDWRQPSNTDRYAEDTGRFNRSAMRRLDELVELSESLGLHVMLTLDSAGSYLGGSWEASPYNRRNGGPAATPAEFFSSPEARALYRSRLRLLVARWSYSTSIACWEFFNEVDNLMHASQPAIPDALVTDWHREMSTYLHGIDPHHHLVTTSRSHREIAGLEELPSLDFTQHHMYGHTGDIPAELSRRASRLGRPHVIGEFSYEWDWSKDFNAISAQMDRDFERGPWLGLVSETPVLPLSWWWEYFEDRGTDARLAPVRRVLDDMLAHGGPFSTLEIRAEGASVQGRGLRCGAAAYLCLWSDLPQAAPVRLVLPSGFSGRPLTLSRADSATGAWGPAQELRAGDEQVSVVLGDKGLVLLRLSPAEGVHP
jgi:hypothetical protein